MNIKLSFNNIMFASILYSPVIALIMEMLVTNLFSKYILLMLLFMYVLFVREQIRVKKYVSIFIASSALATIAIINVMKNGFRDLLNSDLYSFLFLIIVLLAFQNKKIVVDLKKYIEKSEKTILFFVSGFYVLSSAYQILKYSQIAYIKGSFAYSHIFAYYCLAFYAIMICLSNNNSHYKIWIMILKIVSVAMVLLSAVRSASLAMVVVLMFDYFRIKSSSIKTFIFVAVVIIAVYIVYFTDILYSVPVINKTLLALDKGDITNGRDSFANNVLQFFQELPFSDKFFGVGMTPIRNYMFNTYRVAIHAHNDFVNILCAFGIFGSGLFLYSVFKCSFDTRKIWFWLVLFFLAYFNGLFMYSGFCLMIPVVKVALLKPPNVKSLRLSFKL